LVRIRETGQGQINHCFPQAAVKADGVVSQDNHVPVFGRCFLNVLVLHALGDVFGHGIVDKPQVSKVAGVQLGEKHVRHDADQRDEHRVCWYLC
jgi:hypothetical protein